jgi:hypothetical protein
MSMDNDWEAFFQNDGSDIEDTNANANVSSNANANSSKSKSSSSSASGIYNNNSNNDNMNNYDYTTRLDNDEDRQLESPKCSDIYISTKTKISYFNKQIALNDVFWKIPIMPYHTQSEGIIKKQIKFNSSSQEELNLIQEKIKDWFNDLSI